MRGEQDDQPVAITAMPGLDRIADMSLDITWIRERLDAAVSLITSATGRPLGRVEVLIVDDSEMIELNRRYAATDHTTDVLSFDLSDNQPGSPIEVEIAICADEATRRAAEFSHSVERELLLYAIHGVLHAVGYDDQSEQDYALMHAEEDRILQAIGVGATFDAKRSRSPQADRQGGDLA